MSEQLKVKMGIKITADEARTLDPGKMGVMTMTPPQEGDVVGQRAYIAEYQCPWCGNQLFNSDLWDTPHNQWYTCENCGHAFKA